MNSPQEGLQMSDVLNRFGTDIAMLIRGTVIGPLIAPKLNGLEAGFAQA